MEDNIGTGSDNKIPLIIGIGAIAVAVLALAFAIKVKSDSKTFKDDLEKIKTDYAMKSDVSAASAAASRAATDVQDVSGKVAGLETYVNTQVVPAVQSLKTAVEGIVKRPGTATPGHTTPGTGATTTAPVAGPGEYVVKSGDTSLTKIAKVNGTTAAAILAVNPGLNASKLKIGQKLKLPEKK